MLLPRHRAIWVLLCEGQLVLKDANRGKEICRTLLRLYSIRHQVPHKSALEVGSCPITLMQKLALTTSQLLKEVWPGRVQSSGRVSGNQVWVRASKMWVGQILRTK